MVRGHYVDPTVTAQRIEALGAPKTARLLREHLPTTKRAKSGDFGEILATEVAEQQLQYEVPIRRLRWKDGRDMAIRGDDFVGFIDDKGVFQLLKGESKSRAALSPSVLDQASAALDSNRGRPTRHSVIFVADRLRKQERHDLATKLEEAVLSGFRQVTVSHMLFVVSGNCAQQLLTTHLRSVVKRQRIRYAVAVRIPDHKDFISRIFKGL